MGVLLAVAGVLFVVVMITRGDRTPARGAAGTKRGPETRGASPSVQGEAAVTAESDAWPRSPLESASPGSEDRGRMHRQRAEVAGSPPDAVTPDGVRTSDGSPRHVLSRRRLHARHAPRGGEVAGASQGERTVVAGAVGTQRETLGETQTGELAGLADGSTPAVAAPSGGSHTVFASTAQTDYDTSTETAAGDLKGLTSAGGTISLWLQPAWDGTSRDDASLVRIGDDLLRIYKSDHYLRFMITNTDGQPTGLGMPITDWNPGDWHQVVTTWDGHIISFFVDGNLIGQNAYDGQIDLPPDAKLYVGTNAPEGPIAPGRLADLGVRDQALTADAVSRRFAKSRPPPR